ncbi:MAG: hypothetical protein AAGF60_13900 [Pseudomonadota bacterium]
MTRTALIAILAASVSATAGIAGTSDRYKDLRLDTSVTQIDFTSERTSTQGAGVFSTRNSTQTGSNTPYAYISPYGVGPNNDSR